MIRTLTQLVHLRVAVDEAKESLEILLTFTESETEQRLILDAISKVQSLSARSTL